ncbi:glycosyltransferase [Stieleria sp. TO1_6]|uniref:CgeB family protein n=1 Tax=Stieleria tagensis TaxID=2956795 RepID=UPI00209AEE5A|nr:glycosyltransferase [Stieleria tagensis]MCO8120561.1 glycosyltransferase [Stieleria tagensis]
MRIFYAAPDYALDSSMVATQLWRANLHDSLVDLGHQVVEFDIDYKPFNFCLDPKTEEQHRIVNENRTHFSESLIRQLHAAHRQQPIDLFFSYFYSAYVDPQVIRDIGKLGIPTVNWFCNASYQFHLVEEISAAYDYCLVPEKFRLQDYRDAGANPIYCQEAANPNVYRSYDLKRDYPITFVGQNYGNRSHYLGSLHQAGLDIRAWGPLWNKEPDPISGFKQLRRRVRNYLKGRPVQQRLPLECCGPPLSDDDLIKMYSRSKISLGFSAVAELPSDGSEPIRQVRLRDFEATMSGAFYLVEAFDELTDFFEPDHEIVFYRNEEELIDKARYYLSNDQARERIRIAGMNRARSEHTWQQRFDSCFAKMGLNDHGHKRSA